jgi:hypothetical protein
MVLVFLWRITAAKEEVSSKVEEEEEKDVGGVPIVVKLLDLSLSRSAICVVLEHFVRSGFEEGVLQDFLFEVEDRDE